MTTEPSDPSRGTPSARFDAALYPPAARAVAGALVAFSGAALLAILAAVLSGSDPVNPLRLMRLVTALFLLPRLAAWAVRRVYRAVLCVTPAMLFVEQGKRRIEIPLSSISAIRPWLLPLPRTGLTLRIQSERGWSDGIEMENPAALTEAIADAGGHPHLAATARHPSVVYARARARSAFRSWPRLLLRFPVFALVPTIPLFRVHQIIAYGGAFGEYYQYGLGAYVSAFLIYWGTLTTYLLMFAAVLRVPVEVGAAVSAWANPGRAEWARRVLERVAAVLYYGGVPVAVVLRFVPW